MEGLKWTYKQYTYTQSGWKTLGTIAGQFANDFEVVKLCLEKVNKMLRKKLIKCKQIIWNLTCSAVKFFCPGAVKLVFNLRKWPKKKVNKMLRKQLIKCKQIIWGNDLVVSSVLSSSWILPNLQEQSVQDQILFWN